MIGSIYSKAYDMELMMVRAFNHIGPGQAPMFVVSDFCKQVVEIEKGLREPVMKVGNLAAKRDFTDVRDVVKAYIKLIQTGIPGETYNVGSGNAREIRQILNLIISMSEDVYKRQRWSTANTKIELYLQKDSDLRLDFSANSFCEKTKIMFNNNLLWDRDVYKRQVLQSGKIY